MEKDARTSRSLKNIEDKIRTAASKSGGTKTHSPLLLDGRLAQTTRRLVTRDTTVSTESGRLPRLRETGRWQTRLSPKPNDGDT